MSASRLSRILVLLLLLLPLSGIAQTEGESSSLRRYDIDLIIFQYADANAGADEFWDAGVAVPDFSNALILGSEPQKGYKQNPASSSGLQQTRRYLQNNRSRYPILAQMSWRQPAYNKSAVPVYIEGASAGAQIQGTARVSVSRYLHVDLDLYLTTDIGNRPALYAGSQQVSEPGFVTADGTQIYHIRTHRRMRSNELHYIDHPLIGVLVIARPYKPSAGS